MHAQYTLEEKGAYKRGKIPVIVKEGRGLFSGGYGTLKSWVWPGDSAILCNKPGTLVSKRWLRLTFVKI